MKFNSADELIDQMETDKQLAIDAINDKYL